MNAGFWIGLLIFSLVDSKILTYLMVELLLHLQVFNISTHYKKCERANNHNKIYTQIHI